jgi:hypothetical protein
LVRAEGCLRVVCGTERTRSHDTGHTGNRKKFEEAGNARARRNE